MTSSVGIVQRNTYKTLPATEISYPKVYFDTLFGVTPRTIKEYQAYEKCVFFSSRQMMKM